MTGPTRRLFDILIAVIAGVVLFPAFVAALGATLLFSGPPVFFSQRRVGRGGREIEIYKIRTMVPGAEAAHIELASTSMQTTGSFFVPGKTDLRVTGVGKILRKTSIDEYPQLLNVLRGEMSVIGPRPMLLSEVSHLSADSLRRFSVNPGLTGLWQVSGRKKTTSGEAMSLDLKYVEEMSPRLDLKILALTPWAMFSGKGAE